MTTKRIVGVKIEGELKRWRRESQTLVSGTLESVEVFISLKYPLVHYPRGQDTPEHFLARTYGDYYYYLALEEEKK